MNIKYLLYKIYRDKSFKEAINKVKNLPGNFRHGKYRFANEEIIYFLEILAKYKVPNIDSIQRLEEGQIKFVTGKLIISFYSLNKISIHDKTKSKTYVFEKRPDPHLINAENAAERIIGLLNEKDG